VLSARDAAAPSLSEAAAQGLLPGMTSAPLTTRRSHPVRCKVDTLRVAVGLAPGNTASATRPLAHQPLRWLHSGRVQQCPHDEPCIRLCSAGMKN
jgi:hypothetical protein